MPDSLPLFYHRANAGDDELGAICEQMGLTVTYQDIPADAGFILCNEDGRLALKDNSTPKVSGVCVDFLSGETRYRQAHGGGVKEPIAKAAGIKVGQPCRIVDATPGLGRDAMVLVGLGCEVTLIERSPVVAALLADGIARLTRSEPELASRIHLHHGDSIAMMQSMAVDSVDVVYLDPMFPHRKKSALVKKEMRAFQQLLGGDPDADGLLAPALAIASKRVVVKRPGSAPVLADKKPSMAITSKKHRFDVYICY